MCPGSIAEVPFDSVRRFQASLLLQWSRRIYGDSSVTTAQWKQVLNLKHSGYPQVPGSIPAENP